MSKRSKWMEGLLLAEEEFKVGTGDSFRLSEKKVLDFMEQSAQYDLIDADKELVDGYLNYIKFKKSQIREK